MVAMEDVLLMVSAPNTDEEERGLIVRCQGGDQTAFEPLVRRYKRRAAGFALGWTGNHDDALDLSQEAFARAYGALSRFDPDRPFYPWFHRILKNLCLNYLRRKTIRREVPLEDVGPRADRAPLPDVAADRSELRAAVWAAIRRLREQDREILILREFQDLTYAEIASVLDIPRGTVMSRLHHARLRLRDQLVPYVQSRRGPKETT